MLMIATVFLVRPDVFHVLFRHFNAKEEGGKKEKKNLINLLWNSMPCYNVAVIPVFWGEKLRKPGTG